MSGTDSDFDFKALVDYCLEHVGDSVRAAVVVKADDQETLFVRQDIRSQYRDRPGSLSALVRGGRGVQSLLQQVGTGQTAIGEPEAVVITFENAIVIQFLVDAPASLAVSFDREVGQDFVDFIDDCLRQL